MKLISYFYLLIATLIWSLANPLVKLSLDNIDPYFFLFSRFLIVTLVCSPFIYFYLKNRKYTKYDWFNLILFSITGQVSLVIFFIGLDLTTATDAIIIALIGPLVTIAAGHYFYREKINLIKEIGIFIAFFGAIMVIIEPLLIGTNGTAKNRFLGNLLVSINILIGTFWIIYSKFLFGTNSVKLISVMKKVGIKLHKKKYSVIEFSILSFFIAFLFFAPLYPLNYESFNTQALNISNTALAVILYMALLSSILAYILFIKAQTKLEVSEVSILAYLSPLFSLPAAYFLLGETPSIVAGIGLVVIFIGIIVTKSTDKIKFKQ